MVASTIRKSSVKKSPKVVAKKRASSKKAVRSSSKVKAPTKSGAAASKIKATATKERSASSKKAAAEKKKALRVKKASALALRKSLKKAALAKRAAAKKASALKKKSALQAKKVAMRARKLAAKKRSAAKKVKKVLTKVQKRRLARKAKGVPKRATSAFLFFSMANRAKIQKQFGLANNQVADIARKLGEAWNKLSASGRQSYEASAAKDAARAQRERKSFLAKQVKKPCSAYIFFAVDNRQAIMKASKLSNGDIAQVAKKTGEAWRKLGESARKPYHQKALNDKARYLRQQKTSSTPKK